MLKKGAVYMIEPINIVWNKTKKNVEEVINKYIYYNLSVDDCSESLIGEDFLLEELDINKQKNCPLKNEEEKKKRIEYINYVRYSFNKLTSDERKVIYWTYIDKENNYDDRFIANSLGFSLGYYYIKKKETLIRFAYSLGVEQTDDK
jgi:ArpU family phage transcriptional regulator